ncbi:hypothetical protein BpHYR1_019095 [Brachionus plicatilis]|uniref:Uncharacterized protein n=1 Tax=Brachionus plicatilis TaxID=10195 RepID=A0A3M7RSC2_BRAPC|nr:hypothetical protein BpHYR1_019095 [Brachionus plicatilis]
MEHSSQQINSKLADFFKNFNFLENNLMEQNKWNRMAQSCPNISTQRVDLSLLKASWCKMLEGASYFSFKIDRTAMTQIFIVLHILIKYNN